MLAESQSTNPTGTCCIAGSLIIKQLNTIRAVTGIAILIDLKIPWRQQTDMTATVKI